MTDAAEDPGARRSADGTLGVATAAAQTAQSSQEGEAVWAALKSGASADTLALLEELKNPPKQSWASRVGVLAISLLLFVSLGLLQWSATDIAILVAVLFMHEGGHYLAMVACGYRDVKMFFIPLFGAAVSGTAGNVPGYQRALVALAGPLPGIVCGLVLALLLAVSGEPSIGRAAKMLLLLNGFNLLPLLPLDGGHVLQETLFGRSRWLEAGFRALAAVGLLLLAVVARDLILGVLGLFMLSSVPFTLRVSAIVGRLQASGEASVVAASEVTLPFLLRVQEEVEATFPGGVQPSQMATLVRTLVEKFNPQPPGVWATLALLGAYGAGFLLTFVGAVLIALARTGRV